MPASFARATLGRTPAAKTTISASTVLPSLNLSPEASPISCDLFGRHSQADADPQLFELGLEEGGAGRVELTRKEPVEELANRDLCPPGLEGPGDLQSQ